MVGATPAPGDHECGNQEQVLVEDVRRVFTNGLVIVQFACGAAAGS